MTVYLQSTIMMLIVVCLRITKMKTMQNNAVTYVKLIQQATVIEAVD